MDSVALFGGIGSESGREQRDTSRILPNISHCVLTWSKLPNAFVRGEYEFRSGDGAEAQ